MRGTLRVVAGILCAGLAISAAPQTQVVGSIEGTVVRAGTGEPISGVNVEMRRVEGTASSPLGPLVFSPGYTSPGLLVLPTSPNPGDIFQARTAEGGRFAFTNLKPGKYRLLAAHPQGLYYPAEFGQRNPRGPGYNFSVEEAQSMRIRLEMAPMASVSGRVIGADGKPAPHVHVMAAEIAYQNGNSVLNQIQGMQTDDRGDYRLFWLPPGRYYIGAFPNGLRRRFATAAFGPPGAIESVAELFPQALIQYKTEGDSVIREVYETVYAPGETNLDSARIVDLRSGSGVSGIDIALAAGVRRAVRVRGFVVDGKTGQPAQNTSVRAMPRNPGPLIVAPTATTDANGAFDIDGLMQGGYAITATRLVNGAGESGTQFISVGAADIDGLRLVTSTGATLSGRITVDNQATAEYRVALSRGNTFSSGPISSVPAQGAFAISNVQPGNYGVGVTALSSTPDPSVYIRSIRFEGIEVPNGEIRTSENVAGELEVALSRNGGGLDGQVLDGPGQPVPNAIVVVVPTTSRRPDLFKTATTDASGRFRIQGIAPGSYLASAWPWLPQGFWQSAEFLRTVEGRGRTVSVAERSGPDLSLSLMPEVKF